MRKVLAFLLFLLFVIGMTGCANDANIKVSHALDALSSAKARHVVMTTESSLGKIEGITPSDIAMKSEQDFILSGENALLKAAIDLEGIEDAGVDAVRNGIPDTYIKDGFVYYKNNSLYSEDPSASQKYIRQPVSESGLKSYKQLDFPPINVSYQASESGQAKITVAGKEVQADVFDISLPQDYLDKRFKFYGLASLQMLLQYYPDKVHGADYTDIPHDAVKLQEYTCRLYLDGGRILRYEFSFKLTLENSKFIVYPSPISGNTDFEYKETIDVLQTGDSIPIDFPVFTDENTTAPPVPPSFST